MGARLNENLYFFFTLKEMNAEILDPDLYEKAKREVYKIYSKPSAYRSGALVKRYKELGGRYGGKNKEKTALSRWF